MRLVLAPDSYGGFLSAVAACTWVGPRLEARGHQVVRHPMADGGEGILDVLAWHGGGTGGHEPWSRLDDIVVIETARVLGFSCPGMGDPCLDRSSHALGRLLLELEEAGEPGPWVVGLGGTATMDGGIGALAALGLALLDADGRRLALPVSGGDLERVQRIAGEPPLAGTVVSVLADVRTPLEDAPAKFGPQKGLPANRIHRQAAFLRRWARILGAWREEVGFPPLAPDLPGGGAAGGLGYALAAVTGGAVRAGAPWVARATGLARALAGADAVITGEGRLDATSFEGKVMEIVVRAARAAGEAPVVALVGEDRGHPPPPRGPDGVEAAGPPPDLHRFLVAADRLADRLEAGGGRHR